MAVAQPPTQPPSQPPMRTFFDVLADVKKAIVFLGFPGEQQPDIRATGFFIQAENVFHLVTARHVVVDPDGNRTEEKLTAYYNLKSGGVAASPVMQMRQRLGVDWIMSNDGSVDLALVPFGFNPTDADVLTVQKPLFLPIAELPETTDLLFLAFQPNAIPASRVAPVIRGGMVSRINEDGTFYMDGPAFPGNSGSPVFVRPAGTRFTKSGTLIGADPIAFRFVGVVGEYVPYIDVAVSPQTRRPRITFEENTGLTRVWSADHLDRLIGSPAFGEQLKKLRERGLVK